ncbi:(2Fe-2S)-binding protein [Mycoplasmatota bacterium]|nr:(2Fe-2S)-binding protein [Mycoplasmatota bacterium]
MRILKHPVLNFNRGKEIEFVFNGQKMIGYEGETIAAALHASSIKILGYSPYKHRPRGFYCAIGNCAACNMIVNGEPNVRTCVTELKEGDVVETQVGKGEII